MEFASATLNAIGGMYGAPDEPTLAAKVADLQSKFAQLEMELSEVDRNGPYFAGQAFSLVDTAFAPVFRYFDVFDKMGEFGFFEGTPKVSAWRTALAQRASVKAAARADYDELLIGFLIARRSAISARMASKQ